MCLPCYGLRITHEVLDEWASIAQTAVREGTTKSVLQNQSTTVFIAAALNAGTAHTGTEIYLQTSPVSSGDEFWFTQASMTCLVGTGSSTTMGFPVLAASKTIAVSTLPGSFIADGVRTIFLHGTATVANSELCTLVSHTSSAASSVTVLDALANTPAASSTFYNITGVYVIELPQPTNRIRVVYDNTYDSGGATCWTYCAILGKRQ